MAMIRQSKFYWAAHILLHNSDSATVHYTRFLVNLRQDAVDALIKVLSTFFFHAVDNCVSAPVILVRNFLH
jgi:hypothetical protein